MMLLDQDLVLVSTSLDGCHCQDYIKMGLTLSRRLLPNCLLEIMKDVQSTRATEAVRIF